MAKSDGKIDEKEVGELVDIIKDGTDDIKQTIESGTKSEVSHEEKEKK